MLWKARRFITKNGNSRTIAIPREYLEKMRLMLGDAIDIVFDDEAKVLVVRAVEDRRADGRRMNNARTPRQVNV